MTSNPTGGSVPGEATRFLRELYGPALPRGLKIALWTKPNKTSHYLDAPERGDEWAGTPDTYVTASLVNRDHGARKRLKARDAAAIPGVWADLDVAGGPEDRQDKRAAPDRDAALVVAGSILAPTLTVSSGYGVQAWWLFDEPWVFSTDDEHQQAARITHGWETLLRTSAQLHGWTIDSTHDLARLMRLPGTVNAKGGLEAPVTILDDDGPRYSIDAIAERALAVAPVTNVVELADVTPGAAFPQVKFQALIDNVDGFERTWNHQRRDREAAGWSISEYDMALAGVAARSGWSDNEIAALITAHRERWKPGDPKATRRDYLQKTILRARTDIRRQERDESREHSLTELADMGEHANGQPLDPTKAFAHFNTVIGGGMEGAPVVKELVQYGEDPDTSRFVLALADGREVPVGPYSNLRQPRRLDERVAPVTGFVMPTVKDSETWRMALNTLMKVRTVREEPEEPVVGWVRSYMDDRIGMPRDEACRAGEPFEEEDHLYLRLEELSRYIRVVLREPLRTPDLKPMLKRAGFEYRPIHFHRDNGKRSTKSYWYISKEEIE